MSTSDFFSSISSFATPVLAKARRRDPIATARAKFNTTAASQIKLLKDAKQRGFWFQREGSTIVVTLKNGSAILNPAKPRFSLSSPDHAIQFLEKAQAAATAGEFDALFSATTRKVTKGAVGAAPSAATDASSASSGTGDSAQAPAQQASVSSAETPAAAPAQAKPNSPAEGAVSAGQGVSAAAAKPKRK